ncbi:TetR/AcrR family transcriptional regulator [Sanguibacter suaedae]|uniref:TetR family transcriptional regulator n=1 Tax=Sanguibacter suaedae TaxID=2795737 RepID=A0A934IA05_9MICO|nr:TetR family transcriptional regulator [Sanguibacter suaedae]MBI9113955.1 TetR family transcriptional regulator [Sanguibacter suaedae]
MTTAPRRQSRGLARRDAITSAAADLVLELGPGALTHRTIATRAGVPLASTTYYFSSLDDLVAEAGALLAARWSAHAVTVATGVEGPVPVADQARLLAAAVLPDGDEHAVRGHYEHLVAAGRSAALAAAYADARSSLDAVVGALVRTLGLRVPAELVVAVVDGAAVTALSEGHDVHERAQSLLRAVLGSPVRSA